MRQAIFAGIAALLFSAGLPLFLFSDIEQQPVEEILLVIEQPIELPEIKSVELQVQVGASVQKMELEEYLVGVVLSEMPASFHPEAMKAQAVAARTFAMRQLQNGKHEFFDVCTSAACCQAWSSQKQFAEKLGNGCELYLEKVKQAVLETEGEVLCYDGALIDAVYFSCSGGTTEDAAAVWGSEVPYLQSVNSAGEEYSRNFETEVLVPFDQFCVILQEENPDTSFSESYYSWFGAVTRTDGNGVLTMEIGNQLFSGTQLRSLFNLKSTNFTTVITERGIVFEVKGYGHRVGMSQYGANAMANNGSNYEDILRHYYTGVKITKNIP